MDSDLDKVPERMVASEVSQPTWERHVARYRFAANYAKDCNVLDIACGTGYGSEILNFSGANRVIGADVSREALNHALKHYASDHVTFLRADGEALPFSDSVFDLCVSLGTLAHVRRDRHFVAELWRVMKPSGMLVLSTPNRLVTQPGAPISARPRNPFHIREYTLQELRGMLARHFAVAAVYGQVYHPVERLLGRANALSILGRHPGLPVILLGKALGYLRSVVQRNPELRAPIIDSVVLPFERSLLVSAEPRHMILVCVRKAGPA